MVHIAIFLQLYAHTEGHQ